MKARSKRWLAQLLALMMLFSLITVPVQAADNPVALAKTVAQTGQNQTDRVADVTLSVTGLTADTKKRQADVVLVLDTSGSMKNYAALDELKKAAKLFVAKMINDSPQNRIAIVSYSDSAMVQKNFSKDITALNSAITNLSAGGGTNMHAGLFLADALLESQKSIDSAKSVVFMSDGVPTLRCINPYLWTDSYGNYRIGYDSIKDRDGGSVGSYYDSKSALAAQKMAQTIKDKGNKIFTVGLNVTSAEGIATLRDQIPTTTDMYYPAPTAAQLDDMYLKVAGALTSQLSGTGAVIRDTLPEGLSLDSTSFVKKVDNVVMAPRADEITVSSGVLTWNLGDLPYGDTVTLTYRVKADGSQLNGKYGALFTNAQAKLNYNRYNGSGSALPQAMPELVFPRPMALFSPVAVADTATASSGNPLSITADRGLLSNDVNALMNESTLPDNKGTVYSFTDISAAKVADPANGTLTMQPTGAYTYQSRAGFAGTDTFQYKLVTTAMGNASNVILESKPVTVTITVTQPSEMLKVSVRDSSGPKGTAENRGGFSGATSTGSTVFQGDGYADISYSGSKASNLYYQFVKAPVTTLAGMPENGWTKIDLKNATSSNTDVRLENPGQLNRRSYDVTTLANKSDSTSWNDRQTVYKYPFEANDLVPATVAQTLSEYGNYISYSDHTGTEKYRYKASTVFGALNGTGDFYPPNYSATVAYQEASKFWGYFKAPTTGTYYFGIISDDGSTGTITAGGESMRFSNSFQVQSSTWNASPETIGALKGNAVSLTAGQYYPLFMEYFNWGGGSRFQLYYANAPFSTSFVNSVPSNASVVPSSALYPSWSDTPGEYANTVFSGDQGVKFPAEAGDYYILYKGTNANGVSVISGCYGPFTVPGKAEITLGKKAVYADGRTVTKVQPDIQFNIRYTIEPKDIVATAAHKDAPVIYVEGMSIQDDLMDSFTVVKSAETGVFIFPDKERTPNKYTYVLPSIKYTLKVLPDGSKVYQAEKPLLTYDVAVKIKSTVTAATQISKSGLSILNFTDPCDGAKKSQEFANGSIEPDPTIIDGLKLTDRKNSSTIQCVAKLNFAAKMPFHLQRPTRGGITFDFTGATIPAEAIKNRSVAIYKNKVRQPITGTIVGTGGSYTLNVTAGAGDSLGSGDYELMFNIDDSKITHPTVPYTYQWNLTRVHVYDYYDTARTTDLGGSVSPSSAVTLKVVPAPKIQ